MVRPLSEALRASPLFFEPVPSPARTPTHRAEERTAAVIRLIETVPRVDALAIPELVDENHEGQPHYRSGDPRAYGRVLADRTGREVIANKVVAHLSDIPAVEQWARETVDRGIRHVVLVGGSSRYIPYPGPPVSEANRLCRPIFAAAGGSIGNIAIPQRAGEAHRMLSKTRAGASFFTTQLLFDSEAVREVLLRYDLLCRQASLPAATVLLSVAPIADDEDVQFVRWLGADLPDSAERALLEGEESDAVRRSVTIAVTVWEEVVRMARAERLSVPIGVNVEQISARHLEVAGELLREFARRIDAPPVPS
ncbi:MAG: methylenetetrahydrofolate reductase [Thermoplasmata archaeon]